MRVFSRTDEFRFTSLAFTNITLWSRVKVAFSLILTPLTMVLFGRSITVTLRTKSADGEPPPG